MFSERLKQLRKEAGLTQKQVAEKLSMSQPQYNRTENGGRKPSDETLKLFSNFFDVSTDYLLGKSDIRNPYEKSELEILINQLDD
ncbi:TPA: helix-turn-helix transcriptional regulator, partial [Streptococcus suis]|nr:helix-turn-helix transcriptional regulator [Streptococcus suis]